MRMSLVLAAALVVPALTLPAQEKKDPGIYKVEFNIRDAAGAAARPALHYTLLTELNRKAVFRVGNRVPVVSGSTQPGVGVNTQYTYLDIGVSIDCTIAEVNGKIAMHGNLDLSSVVEHDAAAHGANPPNPTVGQTRLELDTAVAPNKPTVIAAIDDPTNLRHFQVETTVTRVD